MNTGEMLLEAILANPDADDPRLMYADWLDEQDDPIGHDHAELIRCQIELSRTTEMIEKHENTSEIAWNCSVFSSHGTGRSFRLTDHANRLGVMCWEVPNPQHVELHKKSCGLLRSHSLPLILDLCRACGIPMQEFLGIENFHIGSSTASYLEKYGRTELKWTFTRGFLSEISLPIRMFCDANLAAIWGHYPITKVGFPDRTPRPRVTNPAWSWIGTDRGFPLHPHLIPENLARHLKARNKMFPEYLSEQEARDDLSQAAVSLGQECVRNAKREAMGVE